MNKKQDSVNNSLNEFLAGKISLFQPIDGYRANTDSILLASAIEAKVGQTVLELGCGVGTVLFSLMSRVPDLRVVGVEIQKRYVELATRNADHNGFKAKILECDITAIPSDAKNLRYDHVILNPPFFSSIGSMPLAQKDKDIAKREGNATLDDWLDIAVKRCSLNGHIILIHRAEKLGQILKKMDRTIGDIKILPVSSFKGKNAHRVIVKGKKGSRAPLQILPPLLIHEICKSDNSQKIYTKIAESILRGGQGINW